MDNKRLRQENLAFVGTQGVSPGQHCGKFSAGFVDRATGRIELARFVNGDPAPMHLIAGLPADWAEERDVDGEICRVKKSVEAGFIKDGVFYTRQQLASLED